MAPLEYSVNWMLGTSTSLNSTVASDFSSFSAQNQAQKTQCTLGASFSSNNRDYNLSFPFYSWEFNTSVRVSHWKSYSPTYSGGGGKVLLLLLLSDVVINGWQETLLLPTQLWWPAWGNKSAFFVGCFVICDQWFHTDILYVIFCIKII